VPLLCERDPEKPKQCVCMKCAGLKEQCKWPEVGGLGLVVDKGKGKAVMTLLSGGEKRKKKKTTVKVIIDNDEIVEVLGPSGQQSGFDPGLFLDWLDWLTRAVEQMTGQMCRVADATRSVARGNEQLKSRISEISNSGSPSTLTGGGGGCIWSSMVLGMASSS